MSVVTSPVPTPLLMLSIRLPNPFMESASRPIQDDTSIHQKQQIPGWNPNMSQCLPVNQIIKQSLRWKFRLNVRDVRKTLRHFPPSIPKADCACAFTSLTIFIPINSKNFMKIVLKGLNDLMNSLPFFYRTLEYSNGIFFLLPSPVNFFYFTIPLRWVELKWET